MEHTGMDKKQESKDMDEMSFVWFEMHGSCWKCSPLGMNNYTKFDI